MAPKNDSIIEEKTPIDEELISRIVNRKTDIEDLKVMGQYFSNSNTKEIREIFVKAVGKYLNNEQIHSLNGVIINNANTLASPLASPPDTTLTFRTADEKIFQELLLLEATLTGSKYQDRTVKLSPPMQKHYEALKDSFYTKRGVPIEKQDEKITNSANFLFGMGLQEQKFSDIKNSRVPNQNENIVGLIIKEVVEETSKLIIKKTQEKCDKDKMNNARKEELSGVLSESLKGLSPNILLREQSNISTKLVEKLNTKSKKILGVQFKPNNIKQIVTNVLGSLSSSNQIIGQNKENVPTKNISEPLEVFFSTNNNISGSSQKDKIKLAEAIQTLTKNQAQPRDKAPLPPIPPRTRSKGSGQQI